MALRWDTKCPHCGKENCVFGHDKFCHECNLRNFMKSQIKQGKRDKKFREEIRCMKEEIRTKLHEEILKELLEEENK